MTPTPTITTAEILEALARARPKMRPDPDGTFTMHEIRLATGWSKDRAHLNLHHLKEAGMLEVHRVLRESLSGSISSVPGYRILAKQRKTA